MNVWEQICCALSDKMSFEFFLPYGPMLTETKKKWQKSKFWNFTIFFKNLVETLPSSMHKFLGANLMCTFRGDGPMLTKTKKTQKWKILKKKISGDMVKRYLFTKFGSNMLHGFWENGFYGRTMDDERTTDARVTTVALLCSSTKQS